MESFNFNRKAKVLVNGVVEDAGGATNMPVSVCFSVCVKCITCNFIIQTAVEPGQAMVEVMIPASKVGLVIGTRTEGCSHDYLQNAIFFLQERVVK